MLYKSLVYKEFTLRQLNNNDVTKDRKEVMSSVIPRKQGLLQQITYLCIKHYVIKVNIFLCVTAMRSQIN